MLPYRVSLPALLGALTLCACAHAPRADRAAPAEATFTCADSLSRADGTRSRTTCVLAREYCYEASGGAAISHGARCRPLPKPKATCADIAVDAGGSCTGTPDTGLRVDFAFP